MENLIPRCINAAIEGGIWGLTILGLTSKLKKYLSH